MITAQELRVGNWLQLHVAGPHKVSAIKQANVVFEGISNGSFYDYSILHGIPLTPKILEKAGFVIYDGGDLVYNNSNGIFRIRKHNYGWMQIQGFNISPGAMEFVHQLQNRYFSLTGTELTINL